MAAQAALAVVLLPGCGGPGSRVAARTTCTQIGCSSAVFVELRDVPPRTATVALCARGRCARAAASDADVIELELRHASRGARVTATIVFRDRRGRVLASARRAARLRTYRPNGPLCPPVCFQAGFTWAHGRLA